MKHFAIKTLLQGILLAGLLGAQLPAAGAAPLQTKAQTEAAAAAEVLEVPHAGLSPTAVTAQYEIIDLGTFGGAAAYAWAINGAGQVVGASSPVGGTDHAFVWQDGVMADLGTLPGSVNSTATDINDNGQVVGVSGHAFLWQVGGMSELPGQGGGSSAFEINNPGDVVGYVNVFDSDKQQWLNHAALWGNGILSDLGTFGAEWGARANAINDFGVIAATAYISPTVQALLLENGSLTNLGSLGGGRSQPEAINNNGQVVGWSLPASGDQHAFLWQGVGMVDLGTLGGSASHAVDLNDLAQVVGLSQTSSGVYHAFLWEDSDEDGQSDPGEMRDLNDWIPADSGWELTVAMGINEAGQIVGRGIHNGLNRAFLLNPPRWTLMFYLAGDNDLANSYPPIFQHLETMADIPGVNLIVLWDNVTDGDSAYYAIQHDTDPNQNYPYEENTNYWPLGEENMSSPEALSTFIDWAMTNYPAQHYALTLDDHGSGLGGGLCETDGADDCAYMMSLAQMKQALMDAHTTTGEKIDVLYMAMCLMGMIEDAYQFRDLVDYYVANEHLQATYVNYLPGLDADLAPPELADLLASNYAAERQGKYHTISVGDIAQLPDLVTATDQLADALLAHMDTITPTLTTIATSVQRYDNEGSASAINTDDTYADLYHLASLIAADLGSYPDITSAAQGVMSAVEAYILYEAHGSSSTYNLENSHGVSIFFPANPSSFYYAENNDFAAGTVWGGSFMRVADEDAVSWGPMLVEYIAQTNPNGPDDPDPPAPRPKESSGYALFLPVTRR